MVQVEYFFGSNTSSFSLSGKASFSPSAKYLSSRHATYFLLKLMKSYEMLI